VCWWGKGRRRVVQAAQHLADVPDAVVRPRTGVLDRPLDVGEHLVAVGVEAVTDHARATGEPDGREVPKQRVDRPRPGARRAPDGVANARDVAGSSRSRWQWHAGVM